jgi:hypothetical protein
MLRRGLAVLSITAFAAAGLPLFAQPAEAIGAPVGFSGSASSTWQTNDVVWATAASQGLVFVGGDFNRIRPPGQPDLVAGPPDADGNPTTVPNPQDLNRAGFAVFDAATGAPTDCQLDVGYTSQASAVTVRAMEMSPDGNTLYVGGLFNRINGVAHGSIAAINVATCTLISTFNPAANGFVKAIKATAQTVYLGGTFGNINGTSRTKVGAVNAVGTASSGAVVAGFNPIFDGATIDGAPTPDVNALNLKPDNTQLVVGGNFDTVNGAPSKALGVVSATTGATVQLFNGTFSKYVNVQQRGSAVKTIAVDSTGFYTGSEGAGKYIFDGRAAFNWGTFAERWRDGCLGATQAVTLYNDVAYFASHAHDCSDIGEYGDGQRRHFLAETTLSNDPENASHAKPVLQGWTPDSSDGTGEGIGPRTLTVASSGGTDYMWSGGEFTTVNGVAQQGLTRFAHNQTSGPVLVPVISATSYKAGQITVAVRTTYDNDDKNLTYRIYRDGASSPSATLGGPSSPWRRPQLSWTDAQPSGSTHTYRVTATDGFNTQTSTTVSATVIGTTSPYAQRINSDAPLLHLRYDEPAGLFLSDSSGNGNSLKMNQSGGSTFQVTGAIANDPSKAITFGGTAANYAVSEKRFEAPTTFSLETWFKTATGAGGKLIGFSDSQILPSQDYSPINAAHHIADKLLYMTNSGQLIFGTEGTAGTKQVLTSPGAYKNNTWHQAVATQDGNGMTLYIDGARVARNTVTTNGGSSGFWRIGGDTIGVTALWPNNPSSDYFSGSLDETAVYERALSATEVSEHFSLGGGTFQDGPTDFYGKTVYDDQPLLQWRLNEASGTVANDSTGSSNRGTYTGTFTFSQPTAVAGTSGTTARSVRLNGSTAQVHSAVALAASATFTTESWVRTASTTGGQIVGFGNAATGDSTSNQDRKVWFRNDGKISYGVRQGTNYYTITSPDAYNDDVFHHVVATRSTTTMALWVDGVQVASLDQVANQSYTGYWRWGGDIFTGWTGAPTSKYLNGYLDELAVYGGVLSPDTIAAHYSAGVPNAGPDVAAPTAPAQVSIGLTGSDASLSWRASLDNKGVTGYDIHRSATPGFTPTPGTLIGSTTTALAYTDVHVPLGTYYYRVVAKDLAGNSTPSNQVSLIVTDVQPPTQPTNLVATGGSSAASLTWTASTDNVEVASYSVYRSGSPNVTASVANLIGTTTTPSFSDVPPGNQTWYYRVVASDAAGNLSPISAEASATIADFEAPTQPATLTSISGGGNVNLSWGASTDNAGVTGYRVYRATTGNFTPDDTASTGNFLKLVAPSTTTYVDTPGLGTWFYKVIATDGSGNRSLPSPETRAYVAITSALNSLADTYANQGAPSTNFGTQTVLVSSLASGSTRIPYFRFSVPPVPAGTSITSAVLRLRSASTTGCNCNTPGTTQPTDVRFADDTWTETGLTYNNRPAFTGPVLTTIPSIPDNASFDANLDVPTMRTVAGAQITLALQASGNDPLNVYSKEQTTTTLRPQLLVSYSPEGFDPDAPTQPTNLAFTRTGGVVHLTWTASADDQPNPVYSIYRSPTPQFVANAGSFVGNSNTTGFDNSPGIGTWYYKILATDATNHVSPTSDELTVAVPDYTAPTAVATVTPSNVGPDVTVTWSTSSDDIGVTGYQLYRGAAADFVPSAATLVATTDSATLTATDHVAAGTWFYLVRARDAVGNYADSTAVQLDVTDADPPTDPANLVATQAGQGVSLDWDDSTDAFGVAYDVYRSQTEGFLLSDETPRTRVTTSEWTDGALVGTYYYRVIAVDPSSNFSANPSNEATVTNFDVTGPAAITDLTAVRNDQSIDLSWTAPADNVGSTSYDIYRSSSPGVLTTGTPLVEDTTATTYNDPTGPGTWYYAVVAIDDATNRSASSNEASAAVDDVSPPTNPTELVAAVDGSAVNLSWTGSTDNVLVDHYAIHRSTQADFALSNETLYDSTPDSDPSYTDHPGDGTWYYRVVAVDTGNNSSVEPSNAVQAVLVDDAAPTAPTVTAAQNLRDVEVNWSGSTDAFGVTGYDLYRSTTAGFTPDASTIVLTDTDLTSYTDVSPAYGTYYYKVIAHDAVAHSSTAGDASVTVVDNVPPSTPNLNAELNNPNVALSWTAATDDVGVTGYEVHRSSIADFTPSATTLITATDGASLSFIDAPGSGTWYYRVIAKDAVGNLGSPSATVTATVVSDPEDVVLKPTADSFVNAAAATTNYGTNTSLQSKGGASGQMYSYLRFLVPAAPVGKTLTNAVLSYRTTTDGTSGTTDAQTINVATDAGWTEAGITWNNKPAIGGAALGTITGATAANTSYSTTLSVNALKPLVGTQFTMGIQGPAATTNNLLLWSRNYTTTAAYQPTLTLTYTPLPSDSQAPTAPTNVAAAVTAGNVALSWTASTDNAGISGYDIHRSATSGFSVTPTTLIGTATDTSYADNPGTGTWYYKVVARDTSNNPSAASGQAQADVLPDTTPPTAPGTPSAIVSGQSVALSWAASTDLFGVTGYEVHRSSDSGFTPSGATLVTTLTGTSYSDSPGVGTWYYAIVATDAANNRSTSGEAPANVASPVAPIVQSLKPTADAFVNAAAATTNYGTNTSLQSKGGASGQVYSYLRFVVPAAPADKTLTSAVLTYRTTTDGTSGSANTSTIKVATDAGWTEAAVNWNNKPAIGGGALGSITGATAANTSYSANLTPSVVAPLAGTQFTMGIQGPASLTDNLLFWSRNYTTTAAYQPTLVLTYNKVNTDTVAPSTPTNLAAPVTGASVNLTWTASTDNVAIAGYQLFRSTTPNFATSAATLIASPAGTSYTDAPGSGTFYYKVMARDSSNNASSASAQATAVLAPDTTAPTAPGTPTAVVTGGAVALSWTGSTDEFGVTGYQVHRSDTSGFTPSPSTLVTSQSGLSYTDHPATGTWYYVIVATDAASNASTSGETPATVDPDTTAPTAPGTPTATVTGQTVGLSWAAATDAFGVTDYQVHRSDTSGFTPSPTTLIGSTTGATTFSDTPGVGTWYYLVVASDAAGNTSTSGEGTATVSAVQPPVVQSVTPTADAFVNQAAATTNYGTNASLQSRGGSSGIYSYLRFVLPAAPAGKTLTSAVLNVHTTTGSGANSADAHTVKVATDAGWTEAAINWNNKPAVGGATLGTLTGASALDHDYAVNLATSAVSPLAGTQFTMAVQGPAATADNLLFWSRDFATASQQPTLVLTYTQVVTDSQAPSTPGNLQASATAGNVGLTWTASTDNTGVTGYQVHRSTTSGFTPTVSTLVASPTGTSYTDHPGTGTFYYKVIAKDAADNSSTASSEATGTVAADTTAPTTSGTPAATVSGAAVQLAWAASTDAYGVTGYQLHRSSTSGFTPGAGTLVISTAGTSYSDNPGVGTWYYKVIASDAAGNQSTSGEGTATVTASGPPTVTTLSPTADTFGNSSAATTTYGTNASLLSRGSPGAASYLRFTLPAAPAGKTLTGAILRLHTSTDSTAGSANTHPINITATNTWTEAALTWNNRPALSGALLGTVSGATAANTSYDTTLSTATLSGLLNSSLSFGITSTGTDSLFLWSRNFGTVAQRPQLILTFS